MPDLELNPDLVLEIREGLKIFKQKNYIIKLTFGKANSSVVFMMICRRLEVYEERWKTKIIRARGILPPL